MFLAHKQTRLLLIINTSWLLYLELLNKIRYLIAYLDSIQRILPLNQVSEMIVYRFIWLSIQTKNKLLRTTEVQILTYVSQLEIILSGML